MMKEKTHQIPYIGVGMSHVGKVICALIVVAACLNLGLCIDRAKHEFLERLDGGAKRCHCEPCGCCDGCSCSKNGCKCASGQHCGALGCKCSVQGKAKGSGVCFFYSDNLIRETPCPKCHKKGLEPGAKSPEVVCLECLWHGTTADLPIDSKLCDWMKTGGPYPKKKKVALPKPETPLLTAVIHDGQARIAWIDEDGQRQECTLPEEEFCKLTAKSKDE